MITLEKRLASLKSLKNYLTAHTEEWQTAKQKALNENGWFTEENIEIAVQNIITKFLDDEKLKAWIAQYRLPEKQKIVGIVMAGNIPLVGFHDFLCGWISGHKLLLKLSSKDSILLSHIIRKLAAWEPATVECVHIAEQLKHCDAYIATGSNNTARYFEQYFGKYPHIIRKNRTSVALLKGNETEEELQALAEDVFRYFGLGCRNVTQLCVPEGYDFAPLLRVFSAHGDIIHHHKYKNNYDYHLAIYLLNKVPYMTNDSILLVENKLPFSAVSVLHYRYYKNAEELISELKTSEEIQCIVGREHIPFGTSQCPALNDYADGVDTMQFLCGL